MYDFSHHLRPHHGLPKLLPCYGLVPNSKKKKEVKRGVTPKTPKRLFPAGCCHSSPLGTLTLGLQSIPTQAYKCGAVGLGLQSIAQTCRPTQNNFRLFARTNFVINRSGVHNSKYYILSCLQRG